MLPALLRTKLIAPRLSWEIVHRPALVQRLNSGLDRPLTLVLAPAGFGKTTLLAEWANQSPRRITWLTLDEGDNDLATFVGYFVTALQQLFPQACPGTQALLRAPELSQPETIALILTNEIDDLPERFVLVLDDYHFITEPAVHQLVNSLLYHPPLQMHLLLTSRSDPPLALPRLRANRAVSELRAADLRFSRQEAEVFLAHMIGVDASEQLASPLWERVEGWIAGLQLASLSIRGTPNAIELAQQFTRGRNRFIMDYLFEQVLQGQTERVQRFLVKTSILERISPALAQAVMAEEPRPSSVVDLVALERAGLFLTALDETDEWFQYHALFRELLYETLQHTCSPEEIAALHRCASLWFRENHLVEEALRHALAASDTELAAQIVAEHVVDQLNRFDWHPLQRWLTQLPVDVIEMHPWLLVAEAFVLHNRSQWDAMRPILKRAEQRANTPDGSIYSAERVLLRAYLDGLWSVHWIASDEAELAKEAAQKSIRNLPPTHIAARELSLVPLANALQSLGDFATGERVLDDVLTQEHLAQSDSPMVLSALFALVLIDLAEGHITKLEQAAGQLRQTSAVANIQLYQAWAYLMLGEAAYESNDLSRAAEHFAAGAALRHAAHTRAGHECLVGLALAQQARGHRDEVQGAVALLLAYHRELATPTLSVEGDSLQGRLALMNGDVESARRWCSGPTPRLAAWWGWLLEVPAITRLRVSVADRTLESLEPVRRELDRLLELATRLHKPRRMAELLTLKALLLDRLEERDAALQALQAALTLGEPRGLVRTIADAGVQLEPLLMVIARRAPSKYIEYILAALQPATGPAVPVESGTPVARQPIVLLTNREQDVLTLLGKRYTDREIAEALVISPVTVRTYIDNLSQKLGVHGRRVVVARARELGLLALT